MSEVLFSSDMFTVTEKSVHQGRFEAMALSPTEIKSNYENIVEESISRVISAGFIVSLKGRDGQLGKKLLPQFHWMFLDPVDGKFVTPLYKLGEHGPVEAELSEKACECLEKDTEFDVVFRLDMRMALADFKAKGYHDMPNGIRIMANDFDGLYITGIRKPLVWDTGNIVGSPKFKLTDPDGDGIYEITLRFGYEPCRDIDGEGNVIWKLKKDISSYPQYESSQLLVDAFYNMSLEEMLLNIREDGAFMAGAKWPQVWTRDVSYAILSALAIIHPQACKKTLMAKVENGRIIQDTGTGGSWPVSTDRMTWAFAAWEVYVVTGDEEWLRTIYDVLKQSVDVDLETIYDSVTGLIYGESSFLDWREQSYPRWMDSKDIFKSRSLGTNAVHYKAYQILGDAAKLLGEPSDIYHKVAESIKDGINTYLWMSDKGHYGQYLYGRDYSSLSPKSETAGEVLCVLFDIANEKQQARIIANIPVVKFGTPNFYPQIPNIHAYHNNGIFLWVQAYWMWAASKSGNRKAVEHGLACFYRAAGLSLTNKEVMNAATGDFTSCSTSSDRQLWTVAGDLAMIYRVFYGMVFHPNRLEFRPFIPKAYDGARTLTNFRYRKAGIMVTINGYGNAIDSVTLDGLPVENAVIPDDMTGEHTLVITMKDEMDSSDFNLVENHWAPETPDVVFDGATLRWDKIQGAVVYRVCKNGKPFATTAATQFPVYEEDVLAEYQVLSIDEKGFESFLSEPIRVLSPRASLIVQPRQTQGSIEAEHGGFTGEGYISLTKEKNLTVAFAAEIKCSGTYSIDFRYANGTNDIAHNNGAAIRTLKVDEQFIGAIVMPQRGEQLWSDWGYSNNLSVDLSEGKHLFTVLFSESNENMNGEINDALIDHMRLTLTG